MASVSYLAGATGPVPTMTRYSEGITPIQDWNLKSNNTTTGIGTAADAVKRTDIYSFPGHLCREFTGTFGGAEDIMLWGVYDAATTLLLGTGAELYAESVESGSYVNYADNSFLGDPAIPESYDTALDLSTAALAGGTPGYSDYVRLQGKFGTNGNYGHHVAWVMLCFKWVES